MHKITAGLLASAAALTLVSAGPVSVGASAPVHPHVTPKAPVLSVQAREPHTRAVDPLGSVGSAVTLSEAVVAVPEVQAPPVKPVAVHVPAQPARPVEQTAVAPAREVPQEALRQAEDGTWGPASYWANDVPLEPMADPGSAPEVLHESEDGTTAPESYWTGTEPLAPVVNADGSPIADPYGLATGEAPVTPSE